MYKKIQLLLFVVVSSTHLFSQDLSLLQSFLIPSELSENANAIVRLENTTIEIHAIDKMVFKNKRIVTVLNSTGDSKIGAYMHYDKGEKIKKIEAKIYNSQGEEIKKFRQKDFIDQSAVAGGTLYSDSRIKYLDYTPMSYPYTVVFDVEVEYASTAYIPSWTPIEAYYVSTQNSKYEIKNLAGIEIRTKTSNFNDYQITEHNKLSFSAENLEALSYEEQSPSFRTFIPKVEVVLVDFSYEGYRGNTNDWSSLGKWMYDELLQNRDVVSESTKSEILQLVDGIEDPIEKAKLVYKFVQDNTRYISVQEGIGGIQPIEAIKVDEVKYGDCKGLSNYTKSLLDIVGVESYYARVYGSRDLVNVNKDFVKFLGYTNHVIIYLPHEKEDIWLECTSQTNPFGYTANFTDDRDVFVITPEGGKIVHTKVYNTSDNLLDTKAYVTLDASGSFEADLVSKSYGTQYGMNYYKESYIENDQILAYKNYWSYINGLTVNDIEFNNNKDSIVFTEAIKVSADRYAAKVGKRLLLQPNLFNRRESAPKKYASRSLPFEIDRGYTDKDTYEIKIPDAFAVEAIMEPVSIENQFGIYKASILQKDESTLVYNREFILNKGNFSKEDYNEYRTFLMQVVKYDKTKIVIKPKT